ncbi:hypothetical protein G8759_31165 [Spirosoma aureum]|uniref:Uncharacterized protein n=1 Tax=Spirosoma aureum TaxID=2692134 RepID=A0A6G9AWP0_9BACT|nr:hypothetical protein [Spirosoma aureum]QIP16784.1 hypothetical protein G8759_31165 [Spirosoma aureum]
MTTKLLTLLHRYHGDFPSTLTEHYLYFQSASGEPHTVTVDQAYIISDSKPGGFRQCTENFDSCLMVINALALGVETVKHG